MTIAKWVEWAEGYNKRGLYSPLSIFFHWTMAALILFQLGYGWYLGTLPAGGTRFIGYKLHTEVGLLVMVLGALRFAWNRQLPGPQNVPEGSFSAKASETIQAFFYFCFFAMPLSGWVMWSSMPSGMELSIAGVIPFPNLPFDQLSMDLQFTLMRGAAVTHKLLAWCLLFAIPGHAGAAVLHYLIKRDKVLHSMLPDFNGPDVSGAMGSGRDIG